MMANNAVLKTEPEIEVVDHNCNSNGNVQFLTMESQWCDGLRTPSVRSSASNVEPNHQVAVREPEAMLKGLIGCGLDVDAAAQVMSQYYLAFTGESTPQSSVVSTVSSKALKLDAWRKRMAALPCDNGYCYLHIVRWSRRPHLKRALGPSPQMQDLISLLRLEDIDMPSARAVSVYRLDGERMCDRLVYHLAERCDDGVRLGTFYQFLACMLRLYPMLNSMILPEPDNTLQVLPMIGRVGSLDLSDDVDSSDADVAEFERIHDAWYATPPEEAEHRDFNFTRHSNPDNWPEFAPRSVPCMSDIPVVDYESRYREGLYTQFRDFVARMQVAGTSGDVELTHDSFSTDQTALVTPFGSQLDESSIHTAIESGNRFEVDSCNMLDVSSRLKYSLLHALPDGCMEIYDGRLQSLDVSWVRTYRRLDSFVVSDVGVYLVSFAPFSLERCFDNVRQIQGSPVIALILASDMIAALEQLQRAGPITIMYCESYGVDYVSQLLVDLDYAPFAVDTRTFVTGCMYRRASDCQLVCLDELTFHAFLSCIVNTYLSIDLNFRRLALLYTSLNEYVNSDVVGNVPCDIGFIRRAFANCVVDNVDDVSDVQPHIQHRVND